MTKKQVVEKYIDEFRSGNQAKIYVRLTMNNCNRVLDETVSLFRTVAVFLLVLTLSACISVDYMTGEMEAKRIRKVGEKAEARIIEIWDTGMTLNNDPIVGFKLNIHPTGKESYETKTQALISRLDVPRIQPGASIPVMIDPADRSKVAINIYKD